MRQQTTDNRQQNIRQRRINTVPQSQVRLGKAAYTSAVSCRLSAVIVVLLAIAYCLLPASSVFALQIPNPLGTTDIFKFVDKLLDALFTVGLPLAVVMILWSALQFLTSGGNPQKIQSAKNTLLYTMIGFGILLLSKGIISFICNFFGATCP